MRKYILLVLLCTVSVSLRAEDVNMRHVFQEVPDSLLPYLTTNNRLDLIDFMDAKMKAVVTNLFEGETEMTFLNDDSLSVQMSEALRIDMSLERIDTTVVVCMKKTYRTQKNQEEVIVCRYDTSSWRLLSSSLSSSTLLRRDEEILAKPRF